MRIPCTFIMALALCGCDEGVVHVSRFPDGSVRERWIEKGPPGGPTAREGEYRSFHPGGGREYSIPYKGGERDGRARAWDPQGRLRAERDWAGGFLVREIRYDTAGRAVTDRRYEVRSAPANAVGPAGDTLTARETCAWTVPEGGHPVRDGLCRMRYPGGGPMAERRFREGKLDGPVKAWYEDGTPWLAGAYAMDLPDGRWKAYTRGGNLLWSAGYARGERDGAWEEWFPDGGRKSSSRFSRGKADGGYQEWYPNGKLRLRGSFANGRRQGLEEAWYPDGSRLYAARFADGRLDGEFLQWHPGGKPRLRCRFARGRKEGLSRVWYPSGTLQEQAYYKAGRLDGPYRTWSPGGLPMAMKEYKDGAMAFDSKAKELLDLLGADQLRVPVGMMGFYWGMGPEECRANLGLYQAARVRSDAREIAADVAAFPDRRPTLAHIRLSFNAQGELWGIRLDLRQESASDFFPLCESLEIEMGTGLGTTGLRRAGGKFAMTRKREWGRFTLIAAPGGIRQDMPVLSAEGFSPGGEGWFRFTLENNLYREYVNPAASITPPRWEAENLFAGR